MKKLTLQVLGTLTLLGDEEPIHADFRSDKIRALLVYLALEAGRQHRRHALAGLLWPEFPDRASLRNLRKALYYLRQTLDQLSPQASDRLLTIDRQSVQLASKHLAVDALRFEELLSRVDQHSHHHLHLCQECLDRLAEADRLYQGEFLAGFSLRNTDAYDEWLLLWRERLQRQAISALDQLTTAYTERDDRDAALACATRLVAFDRFNEKAQRQVMRLLILTGQRSQALAQYESLRQLLHTELGVEPEAKTTALFQLMQAQQHGAASAREAREPAVLHHFPAQFTPFVGRERELRQIEERFLDPQCRLLTLVGAGGIGKTRLAIRAGEQLSTKQHFADGIYFFSLANIVGRESLLSTLARGLGATRSNRSTSQERIIDSLRERHSLLVLDNFEQLIDSAPLLAELLAAAPGLYLLVTSHTPLHLRAEQRLDVAGLPYPAGNEASPDLMAYGAVRLFVESARQTSRAFRLDAENESAVLQICRQVRGNPLALELAAAWVSVMDCGEIAREIGRSLDFLSLSAQDQFSRHKSMAAAFAYSWQLLEPTEQKALGQLTVFRGPFCLEAARAITEVTPLTLARLLEKSLLQRRRDGRYELHAMLRQFIRQQADSQNEQVARQHSEFYLNRVEAQEAALYGPQPRQAVVALQNDLDNIRQAWKWAIEQEQWTIVAKSLEGLGRFFHIAALPQEGASMIALATARIGAGNRPRADLARSSSFFVWRAYFLHKLGRHAEAIETARQALELANQDEAACAEIHSLLGQLLPAVGKFDEAIEYLERAITHYRAAAALDELTRALRRMALACFRRGDHDESMRYCQQAIPLLQALNHKQDLAQLYNLLAGICYEIEDLPQALAYIQQAQTLYEAIDDKLDAAVVAANLASLYNRLGQFEQALASNQRAIDISRELGDRPGQARDLSNRGHILSNIGEFERSLDFYYRALEIEKTLGNASRIAYFQAGIASVYRMQGDEETALTYYDLALPVLLTQANPYHVLGPLLGKAELLYQRREWDTAQALNEQALALAADTGLQEYVRQSRVLAAKLAFANGKHKEARQQMLDVLDETNDETEQAWLRYELWQMTQEKASAEAALEACQIAHDRVPSFIHKKRLRELQQVLVPMLEGADAN